MISAVKRLPTLSAVNHTGQFPAENHGADRLAALTGRLEAIKRETAARWLELEMFLLWLETNCEPVGNRDRGAN